MPVREFTNLQWPETPFGAEQRPFGQHWDMLTAFTLEWTGRPEDAGLPVASAAVYLRVRKHGAAHLIADDTLSIGFRTVVIEDAAEVPDLLRLTDRELTGARRLGVILAGHRLSDDLTRMNILSGVPLRGAAEVLSAWANRAVKQRGVAVMVDTASEASATGADLNMPLEPVPEPVPTCPACAADVARRALARCLAVGLTAAVHTDRYTWEGTFRVADAIDRAAWDVLATDTDTACCPPGGTVASPANTDAVLTPAQG
ncbi:hypothetical protein [Micromonospora sp. WMMD1082]|uniref:hypothetical protein n=1 Tax=Micromonospora sp. WMMD1082 TaxID=3016104 RepID=UPI002417F8FD|nr:hypothetical protein [Micromonospora sp. WMMD1082]MDG4797185.1 hypothetical protein [Micromonospora sp. WMMD1082]